MNRMDGALVSQSVKLWLSISTCDRVIENAGHPTCSWMFSDRVASDEYMQ